MVGVFYISKLRYALFMTYWLYNTIYFVGDFILFDELLVLNAA